MGRPNEVLYKKGPSQIIQKIMTTVLPQILSNSSNLRKAAKGLAGAVALVCLLSLLLSLPESMLLDRLWQSPSTRDSYHLIILTLVLSLAQISLLAALPILLFSGPFMPFGEALRNWILTSFAGFFTGLLTFAAHWITFQHDRAVSLTVWSLRSLVEASANTLCNSLFLIPIQQAYAMKMQNGLPIFKPIQETIYWTGIFEFCYLGVLFFIAYRSILGIHFGYLPPLVAALFMSVLLVVERFLLQPSGESFLITGLGMVHLNLGPSLLALVAINWLVLPALLLVQSIYA